jgi:two-component system, OmpR family, response regulator BaeR
MENFTVLIVEDDHKIAEVLKDYLKQENFNVESINHGDRAIAAVRSILPDLILMDVMLPGKDGLTICREIRSFSTVPILMLTAKVEEIDRLLGLALGADDYICKPFSPREVVARVKAVLRRTRLAEPLAKKLKAGPIIVDSDSHTATVHNQELHLTPNEFALLEILMIRPGQVFTRSDLIARVQGYDFEGYDRTIDSHIKNLRKKIADFLPGQKIIGTVYGIGYTFNPPKTPE